MKAAVVVDLKKVEIQDIPAPVPADNEVLIKVQTAGICGSDLHLFNGTHAFRKPPVVLGHEMAGEIVQVGKDVTGWKVGDRVTVEPQEGCGECPMCQQGLINICDHIKVPGTGTWGGTFAEYFNAPADKLYKLDDKVPYELGTLIEPFAVAVHTVARASVKERDCCVILGAGTIGMLCLVAAREAGFKKIICTDTAPFNREMAVREGAVAAFDPIHEDVEAKVMELTEGVGADLTLVAAGAPNILDQASACTKKRGEIGVVAAITRPIPYTAYSLSHREQTMYGVWTYESEDFKHAADLINGGLDLSSFVTQVLPLEQTQHGLEMLNAKTDPIIKILVRVNG